MEPSYHRAGRRATLATHFRHKNRPCPVKYAIRLAMRGSGTRIAGRIAVWSRVLSRRVAWSVALVATLTMAVSYIDRQAIATLAPSVKAALDISGKEYGWLGSAFSFAYLAATPLCGWWIDRVGARRGLVLSV